ncbi:hypothetical protein SPB21_19030 [Leptothoe sp. ISB3NOV94-8A]
MRHPYSYSWLLRIAAKALKYFLLSLAGCTIASVISIVLDFEIVLTLMVAILEHILSRAFVLVLCLGAVSVITESVRS